MTYTFVPAETLTGERFLCIALAGPSGSGKTKSALEIATGLAAGRRFGFVDTEARRALHYKDSYQFDHCDMRPPFSPDAMTEVIVGAAEKYPVVVVDSMSSEYADEGGLQDMQAEALEKLATGKNGEIDAWKLDAMTAPAWKGPKTAHKKMMGRLLQCRAHLIFCLRADPKIKFVKETYTKRDGSEGTKNAIVDAGFQPVCEKMFMYMMTTSLMFHAKPQGDPGVPEPIKLQDQHKAAFPDGRKVGRAAGEMLSAWAKGSAAPETDADKGTKPPVSTAGFNVETLAREGEDHADMGTDALQSWFRTLPKGAQKALVDAGRMAPLKARAAQNEPVDA